MDLFRLYGSSPYGFRTAYVRLPVVRMGYVSKKSPTDGTETERIRNVTVRRRTVKCEQRYVSYTFRLRLCVESISDVLMYSILAYKYTTMYEYITYIQYSI